MHPRTHTHTHTHTQETYVVSPSSPQMDLEQFQKQAEVIFKEYFDHGNTQEVADSLAEWNHKNYKHKVSLCTSTLAVTQKSAQDRLARKGYMVVVGFGNHC